MAIYQYKGLRPKIGKDCYIAESAEVIGDVSLGNGAAEDRTRVFKNPEGLKSADKRFTGAYICPGSVAWLKRD